MSTNNRPLGNMVINLSMEGTQFSNTLKGIKAQISQAQTAMKANLAVLGNAGDEYATLETKVKGLNEIMKVNEKQIEMLRQKYQQAIATYGEGSTQVARLATQINNAIARQGAWERQLQQTRTRLEELNNGSREFTTRLNEMGESAKKSSEKLKSTGETLTKIFTAPILAVKALGVEISTEISNIVGNIQAMTGETVSQAKKTAQTVKKVWSEGFGDSTDQVAEAVIKIQQNLKGITGKELEGVTEKALTLSKITGADLEESLRGINGMMTNFGISANDAFDLMVTGAQRGLNKSGELEDNMAEYSQLWAQNGFSAKEAFDILENGLQSGAYNFDKINDFVKEFGISLTDGRFADNIGKFSKGTQDLFNHFKKGKATTKDVFNSAINDLKGMKNQQDKLTLASNMWSALGEDNAMKVIESLGNVNHAYDNVTGATNKAANAMNSTPMAQFRAALRGFRADLQPVGDILLNLATSILPKISGPIKSIADKFAKMSPTMQMVTIGIGGFLASLGPILVVSGMVAGSIGNITELLAKLALKFGTATVASTLFEASMAVLTSPITLIVGGIALLGAAFAIAYNKSQPFHDFINNIGSGIVNAYKNVKQFIDGITLMFKGQWVQGGSILQKLGLDGPQLGAIRSAIHQVMDTFNSIKTTFDTTLGATFDSIGKFITSIKLMFKGEWTQGGSILLKLGFTPEMIQATKAAVHSIEDGFNSFKTTVVQVFETVKNSVVSGITYVSGFILPAINAVVTWWKANWDEIKTVVEVILGAIAVIVSIYLMPIFLGIKVALGALAASWKNIWDTIVSILKLAFDVLVSAVQIGWHLISGIFSVFLDLLSGNWKKAWTDLKNTGLNLMNDLWGGLKRIADDIGNVFVNLGKAIANGLLGGLSTGVNAISGGINWILDKVHAPDNLRIPKWTAPKFAKGTDSHQGGPAVVGDGKKHELIQLPNGQMYLSPNTDTLVNLPKGTAVLNGNETEQLMAMGVVPHYAGGIGQIASAAWNGIKSIGSKAVDIAKSFWDYASNPSKLIELAIDKFTNLGGLTDSALGMAQGVINTVSGGAVNWIKGLLDQGGDNPPGAGVERWRSYVVRALEMNGLSTAESMVNKVLKQIQTESGGNPNARQKIIDVNSFNGSGGAMGLMQTITPTFNAYKFPGHGDIFNGFDNILAALNYAKHRYGSSLSALGKGHGYANGGLVFSEQIARIAEGNKPEAIIPLDPLKRTRALQLLSQTQQALGVGSSTSGYDSDFKAIISLLQMIIQKMSDKKENMKQIIMQFITPDERELARLLVDDITDLQDLNNARFKLFQGR